VEVNGQLSLKEGTQRERAAKSLRQKDGEVSGEGDRLKRPTRGILGREEMGKGRAGLFALRGEEGEGKP